jgi:hypothetical protein
VDEGAVPDFEVPDLPALVEVGSGDPLELRVVGYPLGGALDHDVEAGVVLAISHGERDLWVAVQVAALLLGRASADQAAPSCQTPTSGVTCGAPLGRTVKIQ